MCIRDSDQLLDMAVQPKGRLRISLPTSLAQLFLPAVISEFREQHPDIECDFDLSMRPIDPISNPFDLILRFGQQPDSSLISRKIVLMAHQLYASPDYLARHGEPRVPADLTHHECLRPTMREESSFWMLHSGDKVERVQVSGRLSANNVGMLGRLAGQGLHYAAAGVRCDGTRHQASRAGARATRLEPDAPAAIRVAALAHAARQDQGVPGFYPAPAIGFVG